MKKSTKSLRLPNKWVYISAVVFYLNLLAYFYKALYAVFLLNIIMDGHQFRSMTIYNIYIEQLSRGRVAFLMEFQGLEFLSMVFRIIAEVKSKFANDIKQKSNWKSAGYLKQNLDQLCNPFYKANKIV